jgi:hypothetical protein
MAFEPGISGIVSGMSGESGRCAPFGRKFLYLTLRADGLEIFTTCTIDSPLHPLCGSFPRWGTLDFSDDIILADIVQFVPSPLRGAPLSRGAFPIRGCGMQRHLYLTLRADGLEIFSTCTRVQPPSRLWRQPSELRGPGSLSHSRLRTAEIFPVFGSIST